MYASGYEFFEKLRLYEKKPKSAKRLTAEKDFASGYALERSRMGVDEWRVSGMDEREDNPLCQNWRLLRRTSLLEYELGWWRGVVEFRFLPTF